MARRTTVTVDCDKCGRSGADRWAIIAPGEGRCSIDLCVNCARPLRVLVELSPRDRERPTGVEALEQKLIDDL